MEKSNPVEYTGSKEVERTESALWHVISRLEDQCARLAGEIANAAAVVRSLDPCDEPDTGVNELPENPGSLDRLRFCSDCIDENLDVLTRKISRLGALVG